MHFVEMPHITSMPQSFSVNSTESSQGFALNCECTGSPTPHISWKIPRNKKPVDSSYHQRALVVMKNGTLLIRSFYGSESDSGIYTCICENVAGSDTLDNFVTVNCRYCGVGSLLLYITAFNNENGCNCNDSKLQCR